MVDCKEIYTLIDQTMSENIITHEYEITTRILMSFTM